MTRNKDYQRLLNDKRWKKLRAAYLQAHPLCEMCQSVGSVGHVSAAVDVHHKVPVETAQTINEMEKLAYNWDNLQALCIPCHVQVHKEIGKSTRENHIKREQDRLSRWIEKHT